jgi:carbon starvation protein CstA
LSRYVLQELFNWRSKTGAVICTFLTLIPALVFLMATKQKAYMAAWPLFGTSNQLLAALTLLALTIWLIRTGRKWVYAAIPMVFMLAVTITSLTTQIWPVIQRFPSLLRGEVRVDEIIVSTAAIALLVLTLWLIWEAFAVVVLKTKPAGGNARIEHASEG